MTPITTKQIQYIKILMRNKNLIELSEEIALQYSNNRTNKVSELSVQEGIEIIKNLTASEPNNSQRKQEETMRRKIISMAREMAWVISEPSKLNGVSILNANMERINNWCIQYGYLKKPLNEYTFAELPKLVSQFGKLHTQYINELK